MFVALSVSCTSYGSESINPSTLINQMVEELKLNINGYSEEGFLFLNNKPVRVTLKDFRFILINSLNICDDAAVYYNKESIKNRCYTEFYKSFNDWIAVSQNKDITVDAWNAGARYAFSGQNVPMYNSINFNIWLAETRLYQKKESEYLKEKPCYDLRGKILSIESENNKELRKEKEKIFKNQGKIKALEDEKKNINEAWKKFNMQCNYLYQ